MIFNSILDKMGLVKHSRRILALLHRSNSTFPLKCKCFTNLLSPLFNCSVIRHSLFVHVADNIGGSLMSLGNKEKKNIKKLAKSVTHKVSMTINNVFNGQPHENLIYEK